MDVNAAAALVSCNTLPRCALVEFHLTLYHSALLYFFSQVIGCEKFHILAHHVVIGNQIIIRGRSKATTRSLIDLLQVSRVGKASFGFA